MNLYTADVLSLNGHLTFEVVAYSAEHACALIAAEFGTPITLPILVEEVVV